MDKVSMLTAHVETMLDLMRADARVVIVTADLALSCKLEPLFQACPDRCINVGIAEQNMVGVAAGLALGGWHPYIYTFAAFASMRSCEQIRTDLFYSQLNVKVIGTHSGISHSVSGSTHFALEDIGIMRSMPGSIVVAPADANAARQLTIQLSEVGLPAYLRLDRNPLPIVHQADMLQLGRGCVLREGQAATLVAAGAMVHIALRAAEELQTLHGIDVAVLDMHTVKPIDAQMLLEYARRTSTLITLEEHNTTGGLGSAVAEVLAEAGTPTRLLRLGIRETYPDGAPLLHLRRSLHLDVDSVVATVLNGLEAQKAV